MSLSGYSKHFFKMVLSHSKIILAYYRTSTRLRSKKTSESDTQQQKTPVKKQKSRSPDIFLTPVKSEQSDISERQSSYAGSHGDDSEIDLTLSQKSLDLEL